MRIIEEKLERFKNDIMVDVAAQKADLLAVFNHAYEEEFDRKETQYLTESYKIIQTGLKKIDKEKHEILSKAIIDNKMQLLNKRSFVIEGVFELAKKKLRAFAASEDYYEYLVEMIESNLKKIGSGEVEIYINDADEKFLEDLRKRFQCMFLLENKNIDMLGGCKLKNKTAGLFIDDSFAKRLEDQKDTFLQNCKIEIEL